jgi:signal transduction histidine kinase
MRRRLASVRVRTTIGATVVVALALTLAGVTITLILRDRMLGNVDAALRLRGTDIGAIIESGALPEAVAIEGDEDGFAQIVDADGNVVAASSNIDGEPELTDATPETSFDLLVDPVDQGSFRVYIHQTATSDALTVIVGRSLEDVAHTMQTLIWSLTIGIPMLVLLVAATTWIVVGRALRPVDAMRAEVADIGGSDLHRRVPTPASDDEIGRLASTMNAMLDRLEAASERQERFVSDASHELRTPIATVRHELDVARAGPPDELPRAMDDIADENRRMEQLVDDLLLLARQDRAHSDAARAVADHAIVDIDDVAIVEAHRKRPTTKTLDLSGVTEAQVYGDENQLARVMRNLLDNAFRYARARVAITVRVVDPEVELSVDDDGPGVDPLDRQRILERFTRADDDRSRAGGGAGLGLAIADDIVTDHGGSLTVTDSPLLGGARFVVTLPRAPTTT